jgi:hypothetical protein
VYYNYFRPHESLEGKTPAQAGKIQYDVKDWADLTRLPVSKSAEIITHTMPKIQIFKTKILPEKLMSRKHAKREVKGDLYVGRGMVSRRHFKGSKARKGRII